MNTPSHVFGGLEFDPSPEMPSFQSRTRRGHRVPNLTFSGKFVFFPYLEKVTILAAPLG